LLFLQRVAEQSVLLLLLLLLLLLPACSFCHSHCSWQCCCLQCRHRLHCCLEGCRW
jgi:hypothetical protein